MHEYAGLTTPSANIFYSTTLATTGANESKFTKREVQRSINARILQASLGFPPDQKFISALRPEDIARATAIWGANGKHCFAQRTHDLAQAYATTTTTDNGPPLRPTYTL